ncbi:hypothetical protein EVAR_988_1 [Eumeta japonica]|uniref:Reverse transcriptase domain-containing protein n=1 Tax=Eumeta variegata TaxID=151549 RepID=A0A4C1SED8_EUMVA|nr:hypothetical protein EVAR_988_1 [Eumeta japonica]
MPVLSVKCLLYVDDQVILVPLTCELQKTVTKMKDSLKKRGTKANVSKNCLKESKLNMAEKKNRSKTNAVKMRSLHNMCRVSRKSKRGNTDVKDRSGLEEDVVTRKEKAILRWSGHLERMNENRLTKQIYRLNMCKRKLRDCPAVRQRRRNDVKIYDVEVPKIPESAWSIDFFS